MTGLFATFLLVIAPAIQAAGGEGPLEGTSRLGRKLYALADADGSIRKAQQALAADPKNAALVLKLSKAQAAKRQYLEAIATCTAGLKDAPKDAELYLERGHRELGLRDFKTALADLNRAVELDPKLLEAWYHVGMAHYFMAEFDKAADGFGQGLKLAKDNDGVIDYSNWLYASLRRAGKMEEAAKVLTRITPDVKNTGPHLYFYLRLLHFFQGLITEKEVLPPAPTDPTDIEHELSFNTINYGVGNWHVYTKADLPRAHELFSKVVKGSAWNSWGFIGSELELAREKH